MTMITPSYLGETIEYSSLHACRSTLEDPTSNSLIASSASVGTAEQFKVINAGGGNIGFQALVNSNYVTAENNGASPLIANRTSVGAWETFTEFDAGNGNIALRAMNDGKYVTAPNSGASPIIAQSTSIGTAESFTVGFVSGVPPATPGGLAGTPGNSQAVLSWVASLGATGYNLKSSTTTGGPYAVVASNLTSLIYTNTGVINGTTYYYVVSAQNPAGESTNSPQVSVTPGSLNRIAWVASSSTSGSDSPANAIDGNISTRWSTGVPQAPGQWFEVDMGSTNTFYRIVLDATPSPSDYPRGYQVTLSNDGISWGSPIASGAGSSAVTTINFATNAARFIRVTQTNSVSGLFWSIHEFNVFGTGGAVPAAPTGLTAIAGDTQATLNWTAVSGAASYSIKRSTTNGGSYAVIATNVTGLSYTNTGLTDGVLYYFVVSGVNTVGESANSSPVSTRPVSMTLPLLNMASGGGQLQFIWPQDHTGWRLEVQTNSLANGLGTNWVTVSGSNGTNQMTFPINLTNGSFFGRLVYP